MGNEKFKQYDQIFEQVYEKIKYQKRGVLYTVILMVRGEELAKEISNDYDIKENGHLDEDQKILQRLINNPPENYLKNKDNEEKEKEKMKWILVTAFTLIGLYLSVQYLKQRQKGQTESVEATKPQSAPPPPIPAALCLIIPASIASNFKNASNLSVNDLTNLIDSASYFLCTHIKAADSNEQLLEITDEYIPPDSKREVYIRINIDDGRNLIDKKMPYYLKTNLQNNKQYAVKQLACLKNLSGLEKFNRV
ncbi:MAG: hypothetical protein V7K98_16310 [Nostoc sp.]|uniref:hypothetical protein n=1 Tax=Nostoc sp. TaxID=1180 RepID=UPI002FFD49B8